jgi:structure-specific recognition protein 1
MPAKKAEGAKRGGKKTKKEKDPDAPKRNKSAYMFFGNAKRADVKKKFPDLKMTDVSKKIAELWKAIDADDKKVPKSQCRSCD